MYPPSSKDSDDPRPTHIVFRRRGCGSNNSLFPDLHSDGSHLTLPHHTAVPVSTSSPHQTSFTAPAFWRGDVLLRLTPPLPCPNLTIHCRNIHSLADGGIAVEVIHSRTDRGSGGVRDKSKVTGSDTFAVEDMSMGVHMLECIVDFFLSLERVGAERKVCEQRKQRSMFISMSVSMSMSIKAHRKQRERNSP